MGIEVVLLDLESSEISVYAVVQKNNFKVYVFGSVIDKTNKILILVFLVVLKNIFEIETLFGVIKMEVVIVYGSTIIRKGDCMGGILGLKTKELILLIITLKYCFKVV